MLLFSLYMKRKDDFQSILGQSQRSNVYKRFKSHSIACESILFVKNHISYLRGLSNSFSRQLHWFLQLQSCFIKWYEKERNINLHIHNIWRSAWIFLWCLETKQKTCTFSRECARSTEWKLSLTCRLCLLILSVRITTYLHWWQDLLTKLSHEAIKYQ